MGAATEVEMKEKKDRVDDAQHATAAAVEEGVLPGGGVAYIRCIPAVNKLADTLDGDEKTGARIIAKTLSSPLRRIVENAGLEGVVIQNHIETLTGNFGYDARADKYVDMVAEGILDPTKVTRCALENAASIAAILLTTEAIVADIPEDSKSAPAMPEGMDY